MTAANPLRGEASFQAGAETFTLAYDINALVLTEEAAGLDSDALIERLDAGKSIKVLRAAIWAGLQRYHECHLLRAGEIMSEAGVTIAVAAMRKALMAAFPPAEKGKPANPRKATDATGSAG